MTVKTMLKKNKLLIIVAVIYLILFALMPDKATTAIKNSIYYLIEMFEVLPVIFSTAGARCERLGYCPEGEKFTCGKYPLPAPRP